MASLGSLGRFEPVGFWIDTKWAEIRKELEERMDYQKLEVLFCDGGPGIEENLLHPEHACIVSQSEERGGADRGTIDEPYHGSPPSSGAGRQP